MAYPCTENFKNSNCDAAFSSLNLNKLVMLEGSIFFSDDVENFGILLFEITQYWFF